MNCPTSWSLQAQNVLAIDEKLLRTDATQRWLTAFTSRSKDTSHSTSYNPLQVSKVTKPFNQILLWQSHLPFRVLQSRVYMKVTPCKMRVPRAYFVWLNLFQLTFPSSILAGIAGVRMSRACLTTPRASTAWAFSKLWKTCWTRIRDHMFKARIHKKLLSTTCFDTAGFFNQWRHKSLLKHLWNSELHPFIRPLEMAQQSQQD